MNGSRRNERPRPRVAVGLSFALAAIAVSAIHDGAALAAQEGDARNALADEVAARERAFARTMAERDFDAFLAFVSEEAIFFAGQEPLRGRDAVGAGWRRFYEGPEAPFSWEPDRVEVLDSGHLALSTGPVRDPAGEVVGRFNSIWRLDPDGVWRVIFDKGCP